MIGEVGIDQTVLDWFVEQREPWLNTVMQVVTVLGSSVLLIPLVVVVGAWFWYRHGTARPFTLLAVSYGGAYVVSQSLKVIIGRPRPPSGVAIGDYSSYAFPSGHATQAAALWLMLAVVLAAGGPSSRHRVWVWSVAVFTVAVVGVTRLYLGVHWLTDVLGGWAFGSLWFLFVLGASKAISGGREPPEARARIGACAPSPSTPTRSPN
jgi:membrane-associated phospholipid phosphatase